MSNRYNKSRTFINTSETYEEVFEDRGVNDIPQYATRVFRQLTPAQRRTIKTEKYVWKTGDKYEQC